MEYPTMDKYRQCRTDLAELSMKHDDEALSKKRMVNVLWGLEDMTGGVSQRLGLGPEEAGQGSSSSKQGQGQVAGELYGQVYRPLVQALRVGALVSCLPTRSDGQVRAFSGLTGEVVGCNYDYK